MAIDFKLITDTGIDKTHAYARHFAFANTEEIISVSTDIFMSEAKREESLGKRIMSHVFNIPKWTDETKETETVAYTAFKAFIAEAYTYAETNDPFYVDHIPA